MGDDLLPDEPDLELLHTRDYQVRSYRKGDHVVLRGAVRDEGRDVEGADADQLDMRHIGGEAQRAAVLVAERGFGMDTGAGEQGKGLGEDAPLGHGDD